MREKHNETTVFNAKNLCGENRRGEKLHTAHMPTTSITLKEKVLLETLQQRVYHFHHHYQAHRRVANSVDL